MARLSRSYRCSSRTSAVQKVWRLTYWKLDWKLPVSGSSRQRRHAQGIAAYLGLGDGSRHLAGQLPQLRIRHKQADNRRGHPQEAFLHHTQTGGGAATAGDDGHPENQGLQVKLAKARGLS